MAVEVEYAVNLRDNTERKEILLPSLDDFLAMLQSEDCALQAAGQWH